MRHEGKYIVTREQKLVILDAIGDKMTLDKYGRSHIRNLYFDTPSYQLIRRSIEKPVYKEKMRIRAYGNFSTEDTVFVELKKKYKGVVYKRRVSLPYRDALSWTVFKNARGPDTQIGREIDYFTNFYDRLLPRAYLSYEREAYYMTDGSDFRLTFDENVKTRFSDVLFEHGDLGEEILDSDLTLMELKSTCGIPLWLSRVLTRDRIFKTSFSKYGTAYEKYVQDKLPVRSISF